MSNPPSVAPLEDQLRSMILSNVATPQDSNEQRTPARNHQPRNNVGPRVQQPSSNIQQRNVQGQNREQPAIANNGPWRAQPRPQQYQQQQQQRYQPQSRTNVAQPRAQPPNHQPNTILRHDGGGPQQSTSSRGGQTNRGNFRSAPSKFTPLSRSEHSAPTHFNAQYEYLEQIAAQWLPQLEMSQEELASKDQFRYRLEQACQRAAAAAYSIDSPAVRLASFGSLSSGFAMPGSDMDLALVASHLTADLPRLFEKALLDLGHGARLLTRTRVPIIKICESPPPELYAALLEERKKWDDMSLEERIKYDQTGRTEEEAKDDTKEKDETIDAVDGEVDGKPNRVSNNGEPQKENGPRPRRDKKPPKADGDHQQSGTNPATHSGAPPVDLLQHPQSAATDGAQSETAPGPRPARPQRPWFREKRLGPLDFPKSGVGIQCDINFSNPLGLHNTLLLRCYSNCDVRVRFMVLFVKAWASRRKINSGYNGTLSSYGYVLMVLHYLVNVVQPPVCPNLQLTRRTDVPLHAVTGDPNAYCEGYDVRFWRNETEILALAAKGMLSHNQQPLGVLLRGFFHYYAQQGYDAPFGGFMWTQQVLSLRIPGGILTKEAKGWTGAKTTMQDNKEIRHRFLFAIEDPFELDHNVARTVTHNGIVAIRDEFRRAWRILVRVGRGGAAGGAGGRGGGMNGGGRGGGGFGGGNPAFQDGELFDLVEDIAPPKEVAEEVGKGAVGDANGLGKAEAGGEPVIIESMGVSIGT